MHVSQAYITEPAKSLLASSSLAVTAYNEIRSSIENMIGTINNSSKHCNGVVPIKEGCYQLLEEYYGWFREKPLDSFSEKGGPIDVYKEFQQYSELLRVGLEFETGNISSAHRSMNKLALGLAHKDLDFAVLLLPVYKLSYCLTDRVSNYEELYPYFSLVDKIPFVFLGFDAESYDPSYEILPKGRDGMSLRAIHKWKDK